MYLIILSSEKAYKKIISSLDKLFYDEKTILIHLYASTVSLTIFSAASSEFSLSKNEVKKFISFFYSENTYSFLESSQL